MALWDKITSRGNVEDRRGMAPVAYGGIGLTGFAILLLLNVMTGGDLTDVIGQLPPATIGNPAQIDSTQFEGEDPYETFASTVLGSNNDYWMSVAKAGRIIYTQPRLVLFRTATNSGCGTATSQVGPHYCPLDETIYLDETFFDELTSRLGARGGDVAEAYVIAHEVGHHVQNLQGAMDQQANSSQNEFSVRLELQADCYAGLWAKSIEKLQVLTPGEIGEAMDAAAAVGDDRIQESALGYSNPETWTHGSSEERVAWFTTGFESGTIESCNTFQ